MRTMQSKRTLLFITPADRPSTEPILDSTTRKICAAFRQSRKSDYAYGGIHECRCGALSSCCDYFLPDGSKTNSLCIHYVAHHRSAVPAEQLEIIAAFTWGEMDPNQDELQSHAARLAHADTILERRIGSAAAKTFCEWGLNLKSFGALLVSVDPDERASADELFMLLRFISQRMPEFSAALERSKLDVRAWGNESLRLPVWNRAHWYTPMIELLQARYDDPREPRRVACYFRYFRSPGVPIPQALVKFSETAQGEVKEAALIAISALSDG